MTRGHVLLHCRNPRIMGHIFMCGKIRTRGVCESCWPTPDGSILGDPLASDSGEDQEQVGAARLDGWVVWEHRRRLWRTVKFLSLFCHFDTRSYAECTLGEDDFFCCACGRSS
jgi:hypothetical protein